MSENQENNPKDERDAILSVDALDAEALLNLSLEARDRHIARFADSAEREYCNNPELTDFEVMDLYEYSDDQ